MNTKVCSASFYETGNVIKLYPQVIQPLTASFCGWMRELFVNANMILSKKANAAAIKSDDK